MPRASRVVMVATALLIAIPAQAMRFDVVEFDVPFGATVGTWPPATAPGLIGLTSLDKPGRSAANMRSLGLLPLFVTADGVRDVRVVDLDSDGIPDIVGNAKSDKAPMTAVLRLFKGRGGHRFEEDPEFRALDLRGYGETLVIADFDNDGCPDIFNPQYTFQNRCLDIGRPSSVDCRSGATFEASMQAAQSFLLLNTRVGGRCTARFREVAHAAGVSMHAQSKTDPDGVRPESAQGADFDGNGWVDLWVAGHLFLNQGVDASGVPQFEDASPRLGLLEWNGPPLQQRKEGAALPPDCDGTRLRFPLDEGAQLVDWNGDGKLDLVLHHWVCGPSLYEYVEDAPGGPRFMHRPCTLDSRDSCKPMFSSGPPRYEPIRYTGNYGIKAQDLDGDGRVDLVVSGRIPSSAVPKPQGVVVYRNTGVGFEAVDARPLSDLRQGRSGSVAFGDFDRDGRVDVVHAVDSGTAIFLNRTQREGTAGTMYVEVVGPKGERNQFGRVVTFDLPGSGRKIVRMVDGGSGYLSQDEYVVLAPTVVSAPHRVRVGFRAASDVPNRVVEFEMRPGELAKVYEPSVDARAGKVEISKVHTRTRD